MLHRESLRVQRKALRASFRLITAGGCLAMVYTAGTTSPAFVEFLRNLGATDLTFGLVGGLPMMMLAMQFVGAAVTNVIPRRKPLFIGLVILGRFLYIPLSLAPALVAGGAGFSEIGFVLSLVALSSALVNITGPMWLSWMADLIPRRVLNRYWGKRQRWMFLVWMAAYLGAAMLVTVLPYSIRISFPILASLAAVAGMVDVLLFIRVPEPTNVVMRGKPILKTLVAPLRSAAYRPFVIYSCVWYAVVLFSAPFMQVYALTHLRLSVGITTVLWSVIGVGIALTSSFWGRLADRHGHRPVLTVCLAFKWPIMLAFLLATERNALWLLPAALLFDSLWDAGLMVASNGYMLTIAPRRNRSMFIASITGLAGICGGLGAMAGGAFLKASHGLHLVVADGVWTNYHVLFSVSVLLRLGCLFLVRRIHEPTAAPPEKVLSLLRGTWPMRFMLFPVGFYRRVSRF